MKIKELRYSGTASPEITEREIQHRNLARRAAAEGIVLLKNEKETLPIKPGDKIAMYGAGAICTIKGGTGSGDVNERESVNLYQGMVNAGYSVTSGEWLNAYERSYQRAREQWKKTIWDSLDQYEGNCFYAYTAHPFHIPVGELIRDEAKARTDGAETAFFVLCRVAGENAERHIEEGDYLISQKEYALLKQVCDCYRRVVLVINSGGMIDLSFLDDFNNIYGLIYLVQAGQEGGNAFADLVSGAVTPSGKLTDSWADRYEDYPNASFFSYFGEKEFKAEYREGIFVGYRYFDTFNVPVRYCFGHGLSYTDFEMKPVEIGLEKRNGDFELLVKTEVCNKGKTYSGKEVVQIYISCPQKQLVKEFRRLAGFGKTGLLQPGEKEKVEIRIPLYRLASYNERDAAWLLEEGIYGIWMGNSLKDARLIASAVLDADVNMVQCANICERKEPLEELWPEKKLLDKREKQWHELVEKMPVVRIPALEIRREIVLYSREEKADAASDAIVNALSVRQMIQMATGKLQKDAAGVLGASGEAVAGAAAETSDAAAKAPWNVANVILADGPAGLRLNKSYRIIDGAIQKGHYFEGVEGGYLAPEERKEGTVFYQYCTAIPVGTLLAQSWNTELLEETGEMIGREMEYFQVDWWLAPGMNIHRNPLCGRNFEYYSEDPLLSGLMAAAVTDGVQKIPGRGTTVKHLACNNQEADRMGADSILSERTLREIYLKGFEIAVKRAQPMAVMTSYNQINGVHAANCYDLCTKAVRQEWGFKGIIMSDWCTTTESTAGVCTASGCIRAGNDLIMPGNKKDHENLAEELREGTLSPDDLKKCVCRTVAMILKSGRYEGAVPYDALGKRTDC